MVEKRAGVNGSQRGHERGNFIQKGTSPRLTSFRPERLFQQALCVTEASTVTGIVRIGKRGWSFWQDQPSIGDQGRAALAPAWIRLSSGQISLLNNLNISSL